MRGDEELCLRRRRRPILIDTKTTKHAKTTKGPNHPFVLFVVFVPLVFVFPPSRRKPWPPHTRGAVGLCA